MKRDMELVRKILIDISEDNTKLDIDSNSKEDLIYDYHLEIMEQAGLITFKKQVFMGGSAFYVEPPKLTWYGNDYLDAISSENVWSKTKEIIKEKGMEVSNVPFEVLIELAKLQVKNWIGLE